jgi:hypothetical protein
MEITATSTYDECVRAIDESAKEIMLDLADSADGEVSEDEVWTDLATSLLLDADEAVAREVCRCQIGWVPQQLAEHWKRARKS